MLGSMERTRRTTAPTSSPTRTTGPTTTSPASTTSSWTTVSSAAGTIHPDRSGIPDDAAQIIAAVAKDVVPGAMSATVAAGPRRQRSARLLAATDGAAEVLHLGQQRAKAGPTHAALWDDAVVHIEDVLSDQRWPTLAHARTGVRSVLALRLVVPNTSRTIGALTLYSGTPQAFGDTSLAIARAYATHAAIALDTATLQQALGRRDLIGQAKGILMERHRITPEKAFEMLVQVSQNSNRALNDVVERLVLTGDLPAA